MTITQIQTQAQGTSSAMLTPAQVTMAKRGADLKAIISAATKELEGLDTTFEGLFVAHNTRELTNAAGKVLVVLAHGEPNRVDTKALKAAHADLVASFTRPMPWDRPSYKGA
jgi:hypothetical protein